MGTIQHDVVVFIQVGNVGASFYLPNVIPGREREGQIFPKPQHHVACINSQMHLNVRSSSTINKYC